MPLPFQRRPGAQLRPSFSRDFAGLKTLDHGVGPAITFTRASNATYFDADGVLQTASNDAPRFDHSGGSSLGLLIEEARTNSIRNSQAGGAVAGAPGTPPTNWPWGASGGGITRTLATGTANGFNYVDITVSGTPTSTNQLVLDCESASQIVASSGQTWTMSAYVALVSGTIPDLLVGVREATADGTLVTVASTNFVSSLTSSLQRFSHTRTLTGATTERVNGILRFTATNGVALSFTLRIAAPQLEQGAFPTSYIPTTTAAATRSADSAVVTPISGFYNQAEGTLFAEFNRYQVAKSGKFFGFTNETNNAADYNVLESGASVFDSQRYIGVTATPATQWQITFLSALAGTTYRMVGAYASNDFQVAQNGTLGTADASGSIPAANAMGIGCLKGTSTFGQINGHIRKIAYYPKRLSNTLLQQLTT